MGMKFVGGPRHGQDVPDWAYDCSELYVEAGAVQRPGDGIWDHPRVRYSRHILDLPDAHQATFLAPLDAMPLHEIETAARALFQING